MKTTTTTTAKTVHVSFRQDSGMCGDHGLSYGRNKAGQHVVIHYLPAGEDIAPDIFRHDSIEAARETFRRLRDSLRQRGYAEVAR